MRPRFPDTASALLAALFLAGAASCAGPDDRAVMTAESIDARHRADLRAFEAEKARIARSSERGEVFELGEHGRMHVRDVELIGWPSAAYLRVEYTYENTGRADRFAPIVTLVITDPASGESSWLSEEGVLPFGLRLPSGSTYSSWIEVPTRGLHERPDWSWELRVE